MNEVTRLIPLTQGKFAIVSACDFEYLNQWSWTTVRTVSKYSVHWYAYRRKRYGPRSEGKSRCIYMHHEVANRAGLAKSRYYDHQDGDGLHNFRENIRPATQRQNLGNAKKREHCSSHFKGVYWDKHREKWQANIKGERGRTIYLGRFVTEIEAAIAYDAAARKEFGEFALVNFRQRA